jgi:hypothetical protein
MFLLAVARLLQVFLIRRGRRRVTGRSFEVAHASSNHLTDFISAYNYGRRLKTLKGLTPYEIIAKMWTKEPERFRLNPIHQMPGLNA